MRAYLRVGRAPFGANQGLAEPEVDRCGLASLPSKPLQNQALWHRPLESFYSLFKSKAMKIFNAPEKMGLG
ncbi:MAG TPA: hypothetical protein DIT99_12910, partial [Candidatus Latescibacteria bacterium]|nr:hypothetical protein [Candidatus Latescibacterota bacterium]